MDTTAPTPRTDPPGTAPGGSTGAREAILRAAVELIARDGFDGVRLAEIAGHAGVSTALVHYHFTGRDRLLTDALAYSLARAEARLEARADDADRDTPAERLADLVDFGLPLTRDDVLECRLWSELEIRSTRSAPLADALAELRRGILNRLAAVVVDGLDRGDFRDCDPHETATVAMALLDGLTNRLITDPAAPSLDDARRMAGRQLALAIGYSGELPFQPLPDPGPPPPQPPPTRTGRRRAPRAPSHPAAT
ncbi:hypothetical protein B4N89_41655 [Embleya scabrispora]|uniref:HTH tetR-type domain-containing protein n=1 Tax=Embleya scabrispora TaxID=159449 RepID=A0A1T3NLP6_9ACTN|nr:hypothetical protein B4N89_41655 [Embleya scabrispora]